MSCLEAPLKCSAASANVRAPILPGLASIHSQGVFADACARCLQEGEVWGRRRGRRLMASADVARPDMSRLIKHKFAGCSGGLGRHPSLTPPLSQRLQFAFYSSYSIEGRRGNNSPGRDSGGRANDAAITSPAGSDSWCLPFCRCCVPITSWALPSRFRLCTIFMEAEVGARAYYSHRGRRWPT